jgi:hypothetical protein
LYSVYIYPQSCCERTGLGRQKRFEGQTSPRITVGFNSWFHDLAKLETKF